MTNALVVTNHILAYPEDASYSTNVSTYYDQLKVKFIKKSVDGDEQNMATPTRTDILRPGEVWDHDTGNGWQGGIKNDPEVSHYINQEKELFRIYNQEPGGKPFQTKLETKSNGKVVRRHFVAGKSSYLYGHGLQDEEIVVRDDIPNMEPNEPLGPSSSWLRNVTGLWFLFDGKGTTETRDCYVRVDRAALQYFSVVSASGNIRYHEVDVTEKLGNIAYGGGIRGNDTRVFGYQLSREKRERCKREEWQFQGIKFQVSLKRGANGTTKDTLIANVHAMRLSLGDASLGEIDQNTRMAIVGDSATEYLAQDLAKYKMETGKHNP